MEKYRHIGMDWGGTIDHCQNRYQKSKDIWVVEESINTFEFELSVSFDLSVGSG